MVLAADLRDAVTWDGVNAALSMFTATRDSTVPLPAVWPHGEWYRPGIIMELKPEDERGDGEKTLVEVTVADGTGAPTTITATDEHPFWDPEAARWTDAIDLTPGTALRTSTGTWAEGTAVDTRTTPDQQVHNLIVAGIHTYYVGTKPHAILVHNYNSQLQPGQCAGNGQRSVPDDSHLPSDS